MKINYSDQKVIKGEKSIFLAGPTPRSLEVPSWRPEAIKILEELGFDGVVYVPEREYDDRTFNYDNQVWWEREALHNASVIVFWVPRTIPDMPAFTTNVEFGYWLAKNSLKVVYGSPSEAEKNRYLDWLYQTETGIQPKSDLTELLQVAMNMANTNENKADSDSYELNIIKNIIQKYPEITDLVGEVQFTPESYGSTTDTTTYGQVFFENASANQLKEFDRTILGVLLYFYLKDNRYDKFIEQQQGPNTLSRTSFNELREFIIRNFDTPEKENLLLYYIVINDLGKSQKMVDALRTLGIETVDHDLVLKHLMEHNMLPSLNSFSPESRQSLINVLNHGINFGQFIQGECVSYSFNELQNLTDFEKKLMAAEAILDIGGVLGHINNKNGSTVLNQSTTNNFMDATNILASCQDVSKIFEQFLDKKADDFQIKIEHPDIRKAIARICLMMRLTDKTDIAVVENEITTNLEEYKLLIDEFNQSGFDEKPAILLYYAPATLNNTLEYFKKNNSLQPIVDTLRCCLPFMQRVMTETREMNRNKVGGVVTVMLRDAALIAATEPTQLTSFEVCALNDEEVAVQKIIKP